MSLSLSLVAINPSIVGNIISIDNYHDFMSNYEPRRKNKQITKHTHKYRARARTESKKIQWAAWTVHISARYRQTFWIWLLIENAKYLSLATANLYKRPLPNVSSFFSSNRFENDIVIILIRMQSQFIFLFSSFSFVYKYLPKQNLNWFLFFCVANWKRNALPPFRMIQAIKVLFNFDIDVVWSLVFFVALCLSQYTHTHTHKTHWIKK